MTELLWSPDGQPSNTEAALTDAVRALRQFADAFQPLTLRQRAEKLLVSRVLDNARYFLLGDTTTPTVAVVPLEEPTPILSGYDDSRRNLVARCLALRAQGGTQERIAGEMEVSAGTVRRMLKLRR